MIMQLMKFATILVLAFLMNACFSAKYQTYTSAPQRTTNLDSAKVVTGPIRIPPPDSLEVTFEVVTNDTACPVKIELRDVMTRLQQVLVDSVYSPGKYTFRWEARDSLGGKLRQNRYYYKIFSCKKSWTKKFDYRNKYE